MLADSEYVWLEKAVVSGVLEKYRPDLIKNDRAPIWAVVVADAYYCTMLFHPPDLMVVDILNQVEKDLDLQNAIVGAYRMGAGAFAILSLILDNKPEETNGR